MSLLCRLTARLVFAAMLSALLMMQAQADFLFTAPPRETPEAGQAMYGPIAEAMTRVLGEQVTYQHPKDWLTYSKDIRKGNYDIVFDGPHFAAWRIAHINHVPVARLRGHLAFYVVASDDSLNTVEDLVGKPVCALTSPNLGTLTLLYQFKNPARQPIIRQMKGGFGGVFKGLKQERCGAAVQRTAFYDKKVSAEDKIGVRTIFTSDQMPNQVITVGPRLTGEQRQALTNAFTKDDGIGAQASAKLFQRFSRTSTAFIQTNSEEFEGLNLLLEGVVWGW